MADNESNLNLANEMHDDAEDMEDECPDNDDECPDDDDECPDDDDEWEDDEDDVGADVENTEEKVYLPSHSNDEGPLEYDESAYVMYHKVRTSYPCLSFDVIQDGLGNDRADSYPVTMTLVGGTQANKVQHNNLVIMKLSNMNRRKPHADKENDEEEEEEDSESDEDNEDGKPILDCATVHHPGCVNRVKATNLGGKPIVASWSESGRILIWDISHPLEAVNNHHVMTKYVKNNEEPKSIFSFNGNNVEGYALAWSKLMPGTLLSGDCRKNIHIWKPREDVSWNVDQRPYKGHTASVEDIQWSPNESNVMVSCSADKSIRIWDIRAAPDKACMLTKESAHESDVNVLDWNRFDPLILSGGDDGEIKVWDLRMFPNKPAVCTFKHHVAPITSVEWHPSDSSTFAASGADNQLTIWDLAVERDMDQEQKDVSPAVMSLPPQLLFIHQGQEEIKEIHWHPQMPGVVISTAMSGFNVFRTISV